MKTLLALILLLVIVGGAGAYIAVQRVDQPFRAADAPAQIVAIPPGSSTAAIGRALVDAGVVRDTLTFRLTLWRTGEARRLKAGDYRFDGALSARDVVEQDRARRSRRGDRPFREGLTIKEMAPIFEASGLGVAQDFLQAARDGSLVASLDPGARDLEGYLFPEPTRCRAALTRRQLVAAHGRPLSRTC